LVKSINFFINHLHLAHGNVPCNLCFTYIRINNSKKATELFFHKVFISNIQEAL